MSAAKMLCARKDLLSECKKIQCVRKTIVDVANTNTDIFENVWRKIDSPNSGVELAPTEETNAQSLTFTALLSDISTDC